MIYSKYNILSKIKDSDSHFIVNLLSGNADILSKSEADLTLEFKNKGLNDSDFAKELQEKGYFSEPSTEKKNYQKAYFDFVDNRDSDEVQIFFVPNYSCNFACTYCFQDEYSYPKNDLCSEVIDSFFAYVVKEFADRSKYITIFGGEPLLVNPKQMQMVEYIITSAKNHGIDISVVTNGYYLEEYIEILKKGNIREVQVTLDGTEDFHNERRFLKDKSATFDKIVKGIDAALSNQITINLRMVLDKMNMMNLPDLARFTIAKGWTKSEFFKTQIGRNYELHHCQSTSLQLYNRISLYEDLFELIKANPEIVEFYKPAYSVAKFLSENGELPSPLFDSCPACKTEWAFDYSGNIYSCTATVGKSDEVLGTFYPEITLKKDIIEEWQSRDVTEIPECKECSLQLACGGGCGSVAKNASGKICSTDCRPVKELLELGFAAYFNNEIE